MAFIEWSESMSVGNPAIDRDHQIIVTMINRLHDNVGSSQDEKELSDTLNTLVDYTLKHFEREERVMQACKYPFFKQHQQLHEQLRDQVTEIIDRVKEQGKLVVQDELLEFLKDWLINHILKQDMGFRSFVENNTEVQILTKSLLKEQGSPLDY